MERQTVSLRTPVQKIMLISPPGKITVTDEGSRERKLAVPPLGPASLAASLLQHGYEVDILDVMMEGYENEQSNGNQILYGLSDDDVRKRIADFNPDMIGVSCLFSNRGLEAQNLCRLAKETIPDAFVVFGGQHPSGMPQLVIDENIDCIMYGEADRSIIELVETLNTGGDLRDVKQIILQDGDTYWKSPKNDYPDPKELPLPAWHLVGLDKYWNAGLADYEINLKSQQKFLIMMSSRGCPHACYFCTAPMMSDRRFRMKEIPQVIEEIQHYRDTYGVDEIHFWDDNFFINKKRVKKLLKALVENFPDMSFQVPSGSEVNAIDDEVIELLSQAGFTKLFMAIESLNPDIQEDVIDKHVDLARVPDIVEKLRVKGIISEGSFMVGFPGESKAQIDHTFDTASKLGLDRISVSIVNPLPGTPLYDECIEKDLVYDDFDPQNVRWSTENIKMEEVDRGYISKRRREVWESYMKDKIDITKYETQNIVTDYDRDE
ncbi:MAG: B12-binding domain-containing radical SAM protein [Rhodospirillaceae bacterium]|nr:B12-binding domain-containing radical SAM protein [Rhodospirillaceae bacterium]